MAGPVALPAVEEDKPGSGIDVSLMDWLVIFLLEAGAFLAKDIFKPLPNVIDLASRFIRRVEPSLLNFVVSRKFSIGSNWLHGNYE